MRRPSAQPFAPTRRRLIACVIGAGLPRWSRAGELAGEKPEASMIVDWDRALLESIKTSATSPCLASRSLALLHQAAHDAFITQSGGTPLLRPQGGITYAPSSPRATLAAAAATVAISLYPAHRSAFEALLEKQLRGVPTDSHRPAQEAGAAWAAAHLGAREGDGASRNVTYVPTPGPGRWQRTPTKMRPPELPHWSQVQPFTLSSARQFRPGPPPDLASREYASGWARVREVGGVKSLVRTSEETDVAKFWSCFSYTVTPAGHWNSVLGDLAQSRSLPLADTVRAFATLALVMADASIAAWDAKYAYNFWRPVQAIPKAGEDGNPKTAADTHWKPLLETPPHPEYVSGHSVFARAGVEVMRSVFNQQDIPFKTYSDTLPDVQRSFSSFQSAADEMSASRIFGGIHFPFSTVAGQKLGKEVADRTLSWVHKKLIS